MGSTALAWLAILAAGQERLVRRLAVQRCAKSGLGRRRSNDLLKMLVRLCTSV